MFSARDQRDVLSSIRLADGQTRRIDCPFCGGRKTFTITSRRGQRVWNCYKASCTGRGAASTERSVDEIRRALDGAAPGPEKPWTRPLPELRADPLQHAAARAWLESNHCMGAYEAGRAQIDYDPKEDRVVFWTGPGGAVGRALSPGKKPKWLAYGDVSGGFFCGDAPTAVVVEDAASACAVSGLATGVALLGAKVTQPIKIRLMAFEKVIMALDNDASARAIRELQKIGGAVPATIRFLQDDLKYLPEEHIKRVLGL